MRKFEHIGRIDQLRNSGRELIGQHISWTCKRDGQNVRFWWDGENVTFGSRNMEVAEASFQNAIRACPEYPRVVELITDHQGLIVYAEHMPVGRGPCRIEPKRKYQHLVIIDIYVRKTDSYITYNATHQMAHHYRIPIVELVRESRSKTVEDILVIRDEMLKWCKRHRKEGVVGKLYYTKDQTFFKEKIDLPKIQRVSRHIIEKPHMPVMPADKIEHAISQAREECERNDEDFKNPKFGMPRVVRHLATQSREHDYSVPRDIFQHYKQFIEDENERMYRTPLITGGLHRR